MRSYLRLRTHSASPIPSSFASHSSHPAIPLTLVPSASPLLSSFSITFESPRLLHSLASVPSLFPPIAAPSTPSSSKNHPSMYSSWIPMCVASVPIPMTLSTGVFIQLISSSSCCWNRNCCTNTYFVHSLSCSLSPFSLFLSCLFASSFSSCSRVLSVPELEVSLSLSLPIPAVPSAASPQYMNR
eukprot:45868_1